MFYDQAVDKKLLLALSTIEYQQEAATQVTNNAFLVILDYVATYPNDGIGYGKSGTNYHFMPTVVTAM